jgi:hypothetical protein
MDLEVIRREAVDREDVVVAHSDGTERRPSRPSPTSPISKAATSRALDTSTRTPGRVTRTPGRVTRTPGASPGHRGASPGHRGASPGQGRVSPGHAKDGRRVRVASASVRTASAEVRVPWWGDPGGTASAQAGQTKELAPGTRLDSLLPHAEESSLH